MERIDLPQIAHAILSAPGWARVGISAPNERLREEAALELARALVGSERHDSGDQLNLL